ncbi:hypothetical protein BDU57DRAFT_524715 [Ampelomyces quisqualis]|uniref:Uncharacterized protein n=1 Tax=Ampelomyces quisqualis TaxID=50730 RepID=A0A6A5Q667_AMPQU|nr:hypothetical protein BDU57DRAFT_524715 [Ampelomyces quisqualis]
MILASGLSYIPEPLSLVKPSVFGPPPSEKPFLPGPLPRETPRLLQTSSQTSLIGTIKEISNSKKIYP